MKPGPQIPVAVFITSFHPGGTERQMIELVHRLDRNRFDVHVACTHKEGPWLSQVEASAPVTAFPIRGFAHPTMVAQGAAFARWCRAEKIAVVQSCELYGNVFALPFAAMGGVPARIGSRRELNPDKTRTQMTLQRQSYRFAHAIVANSNAAARQLEHEGIRSDRIAIVPNGVDIDRFDAPRPRRPITTVLTVANLRTEKAHEVLLTAAARLLLRHPHLRFLIAGDGPRMADLRAMADALRLDASVRFLGHREDIPALLAEADLFVLPSRSEAFPNSAIEAMAAGLPVVASAAGGLLDLIADGETGVLVRPDDPVALGDAIDALVRSPEWAAALGSNARDAVTRGYSFDRMVRAFEDLYLTHLGMPRGVSSRAA